MNLSARQTRIPVFWWEHSVRSSGCDEPSEMSSVKNAMSSLIKCMNYANNFEKRLDTSPLESKDNLLMIQLILIQL